jgi:hypothetical protein
MSRALRKFSERNGFLSVLYNIPRLAKGYQPIYLDYPVKPVARYGYGKPPHPELTRILEAGEGKYIESLSRFLDLSRHLLNIPLRHSKSPLEPCWINKWFDGLDTFALYGFVATGRPSLYIEVGSGYSTKVVRRAITDHQLGTKLVSIDPHPRAQIDKLCDEIIRQPLEDCDLTLIRDLKAGDVFFVDGSHRSFMNSDVTVLFLEILPRLKAGVLVHIHDVYLPLDYMPNRAHWYYSEQYLLAASLLAGHSGYDVILPNNYISITPHLANVLVPFWGLPELTGVPQNGCSFWLRTQ